MRGTGWRRMKFQVGIKVGFSTRRLRRLLWVTEDRVGLEVDGEIIYFCNLSDPQQVNSTVHNCITTLNFLIT